ncbi:MAG: glycosyltransferase [Anaerolineae bacterium]|nr:glycosyltransferase [Anaerolineae bacterium]
MKPIRIMYIITRLSIGSPAMHVTLLAEKMGAPDYESMLVCGMSEPHGGDMRYFAEEHGVQPVFIPNLGGPINPLTYIRVIRQLYGLMREYQPDIVHTHLAKAGFAGRMAAMLVGVPVVVHTFHTHSYYNHFGPVMTRVLTLLERLLARRTDSIITLTQNLRRELADHYHITRKSRITVLPLGLDLSRFAQTPRKQGVFRQQWGIPSDVPLVGIVGQLSPVKDPLLFLDAAALVRQQMPTCRFVIVGDGEIRAEIEAKIQVLNLQSAVTMTGWLSDLTSLYSDLDLLVNSSTTEGTPTPIMEALTAGVPVVATAVGGVPDMLDHGRLGLLVFAHHPETLADAIQLALSDPQDTQAGQEIMLNRYGIDRLIRDLDSLYRGLLAKKGRI